MRSHYRLLRILMLLSHRSRVCRRAGLHAAGCPGRPGSTLRALAAWCLPPIPTGNLPTAAAVNPITNKIYVANQYSDNVTVIDGATNATSTVPVGERSQCGCREPGHEPDLHRQQYAHPV